MKKMMILSMMLAMVSGLAACGTQDNTTTAKAAASAKIETVLNTTTAAQTTVSSAITTTSAASSKAETSAHSVTEGTTTFLTAGTTLTTTVLTTSAPVTKAETQPATKVQVITTKAVTKKTAKTTTAKKTEKENTTEMNGAICGGWSVVSDSAIAQNENAKKALKKATQTMVGAAYEPLAVLGTQVVAGTNYCILCRLNAVTPDAQPTIELVYVYENLSGNASVIGHKTIIGEMLMGGLTANAGETAMDKNADVQRVFDDATKELTGISYEPAAYLGSQQVAGMNYLILCKSAPVVPNAETTWSLVTVGSDLSGKASVVQTDDISLGDME